MSRALLLTAYSLITPFIAVAEAACVQPLSPTRIPDGATASDEDMNIAMLTMSHFEADVNNYLKCLAFEVSQGRLSAGERARLSEDTLERHQATIKRLNTQMRVYMAR